MRQVTAPAAQITFFGGIQPHGAIGAEDFKAHDATATWADNGVAAELVAEDFDRLEQQVTAAVRGLRESLTKDMAAYGAHQVRDAVAEYVSQGYLDGAVIGGEACLVFDASNEEVQFRVFWKLGDLLDAIRIAAEKAGNRQMLSALDTAARRVVGTTTPELPGEEVKRNLEVRRVTTQAQQRISQGRRLSART
jgi:hypothetical protein